MALEAHLALTVAADDLWPAEDGRRFRTFAVVPFALEWESSVHARPGAIACTLTVDGLT